MTNSAEDSMSDDLVARLQRWKHVVPTTRERQMIEDMREAAAALEAKDARIAELEARVAAAEANVDAFLDERDAAPPQADAEALLREWLACGISRDAGKYVE